MKDTLTISQKSKEEVPQYLLHFRIANINKKQTT